MPDKEKKTDSDKKIRKMAIDIVNELLKSGEYVNVDIKTADTMAQKCKASFGFCGDYTCPKKFDCQYPKGYRCGKFADSIDFTLSV